MHKRIARQVALRILNRKAYEAQGDLHKMIGQIISRTMGMTDAPQDFFVAVESIFLTDLDEAGLEYDLQDPDVYPVLRRAIMKAVEAQGM